MPLRLGIRHWELLVALDAAGTMRGAADRLGLSQSALSHRLAEAERRLGTTLFEREGRRLRPLPAAEIATTTARQALPALARAEEAVAGLAADAARLVRLGVAAYSAYHWLPRFLGGHGGGDPPLRVELVAAATQRPARSLLDGAADLVVAPAHLAVPGTVAEPLFRDPLVLAVPPGHPLADRAHLAPEDLAAETYLTYSRTTEPGFEYERFIRPAGVIPRRLVAIEMTDAIVELVAAGFGVSILARWAIAPALAAGRLEEVRVGRGGLHLDWAALRRAADPETAPARRLAGRLAAWCRGAPPEPS